MRELKLYLIIFCLIVLQSPYVSWSFFRLLLLLIVVCSRLLVIFLALFGAHFINNYFCVRVIVVVRCRFIDMLYSSPALKSQSVPSPL